MKDAMDGKIDMIITKAVSRFARNLMDCIGWVEALQNHDPPVRVFFEQENLDTLSQTSGIIRGIAMGEPVSLISGIAILLVYLAVFTAIAFWFIYKKKNL